MRLSRHQSQARPTWLRLVRGVAAGWSEGRSVEFRLAEKVENMAKRFEYLLREEILR